MTKENTVRNTEIKELRKKGWTLQEIATKFNIKRQRVHQIIKAL